MLGFDHGAATCAIYRTAAGFFVSGGRCTHEAADLAEGFVIGDVIECPLRQGHYHTPSGKALGASVGVNPLAYPTRIEAGRAFIGLPATAKGAFQSRALTLQ